VHVCATLAGVAIIAQPSFAQETAGPMVYARMMQGASVKMASAARDVKLLQGAQMGVAIMAFAFLFQVPARAANANARRASLAWHVRWKYAQVPSQARCAVVMANATTRICWLELNPHVNAKLAGVV